MFVRELKVNFKSFIVWMSALLALFLVVFLVYPSIVNSENIQLLDEMMEIFPPEILKAFNMDISSIKSAYGWLKSEGFVFVLLIVGCYAGMLGSSIILKEENDKTIEYLNSLPVKRKDIVLSKVAVGAIYVVSMIVILGLFNFICLLFSDDFDKKQYLLLSVTPLFSSLAIFFLCVFISTFTHKTKKIIGFSLGIVLISYFLQVLSTLADSVGFLKYFSVFTLADIRNVIINNSINPLMVIISIVLSSLLLIASIYRYQRKELV